MFGGRFSHTKFSLRDRAEREISISSVFMENVKSLVSFRKDVSAEHNFRCTFGAELTATRGVSFLHTFTENISSVALGSADYMFSAVFAENMMSDVYLSSDIAVRNTFTESVNANLYLGKDVSFLHEYKETVNADAFLGKNTPLTADMRENLFARLNAAIVDKDTVTVSIAIPPGSELRIDSENFTVTLDGEDVVHRHDNTSGWIMIARDTVDITVATGDGELDGKIMYLERFL